MVLAYTIRVLYKYLDFTTLSPPICGAIGWFRVIFYKRFSGNVLTTTTNLTSSLGIIVYCGTFNNGV